ETLAMKELLRSRATGCTVSRGGSGRADWEAHRCRPQRRSSLAGGPCGRARGQHPHAPKLRGRQVHALPPPAPPEQAARAKRVLAALRSGAPPRNRGAGQITTTASGTPTEHRTPRPTPCRARTTPGSPQCLGDLKTAALTRQGSFQNTGPGEIPSSPRSLV